MLLGGRRLDILYPLSREPEFCVCELVDAMATTVSASSHQLRILSQRRLVRPRRDGQTIFYALTNAARELLTTQENFHGHA